MPSSWFDDEAASLYQRYILDTGFTPPTTYCELELFVSLSGAPVVYLKNATVNFRGVQIEELIIISDSPHWTDYQRLRFLAHEWCHWLRREVVNLFSKDLEESIANSFMMLF